MFGFSNVVYLLFTHKSSLKDNEQLIGYVLQDMMNSQQWSPGILD